jgi:heterodisulfide reductase subunit C
MEFMIQQLIFAILLLLVAYFAYRKYSQLVYNIRLGKAEEIKGNTSDRWRNVFLIAFGQKKMFKRLLPAVFHLFIYVAFLITQIELIEILVDGLGGVHRFFAPYLGVVYTFIISSIEILSVLALVATLIFLVRRNLLVVPRFNKPEMKGWPKMDGNIILFAEIVLVAGIFMMNGADTLLQGLDPAHYPQTGNFAISSWLGPLLFEGFDTSSLIMIERIGWWMHIIVVFAFLAYLPYSKHLHILLAFPNTYFANDQKRGEMSAMPEITSEIKSMLGLSSEEVPMDDDIPEFGAKDVTDLSWRTILGAYTCTECGRCTSVCPANQTGKKLSPRKIMMDIRDRTEEVGLKIKSGDVSFVKEGAEGPLTKENFDDGKSLFDLVSREELHACTTCNACVEACPVMINPLEPILEMRRYEILTESAGPQEWLPMFTSMENSGAVWQMPDAREDWTKQL